MIQHPTYTELEYQVRYNRFREAAAINQQLQLLPKVQRQQSIVKTAIRQPLGNVLINVGLKLTENQATT